MQLQLPIFPREAKLINSRLGITTEYWVNDSQGKPVMMVMGELTEKLQTVIEHQIIPQLFQTRLISKQMDLMDIMEDRHGRASTIVTSQLPVANWYDVFCGGIIAGAVLDRLVHTSYRVEFNGYENLIKKTGKFSVIRVL